MDLSRLAFGDLLESIGARTPTPGGGAAAAVTGGIAVSLAMMVTRYSLDKKGLEEHRQRLEEALSALSELRVRLLDLASEDARAYEALSRVLRMPKDDPARAGLLAGAAAEAVQPPRGAALACVELLELLVGLAPITNRMLRSDLAIAALLGEAAVRASRWNMEANTPLLPPREADGVRAEADRLTAAADRNCRAVEAACGG